MEGGKRVFFAGLAYKITEKKMAPETTAGRTSFSDDIHFFQNDPVQNNKLSYN